MSRSTVTTNLIAYAALHGARYVLPLVVTPLLAYRLGLEGFGHYAVLLSCAWTASVIVDFGFPMHGISKIAASRDGAERARHTSDIVGAKLLLAPLAILAYLGLISAAGVWAIEPRATVLGLLGALVLGANFAWYFQGRERGPTGVLIEGGPQVAQIIGVYMFVNSPADAWIALLFFFIAPVISILLSLLLLSRDRVRLRPSISGGLAAMREALPLFTERFFFALYTAATPTIVATLAGLGQAGLYSVADKVMVFLGSLVGPVSQAITPVISRMASAEQWRAARLTVGAVVAFCGAGALVGSFFIEPIVVWLFPLDYLDAVPAARVLCLAAFCYCVARALTNFVLVPQRALVALVPSASLAFVASLVATLIMVPSHGAIGAAWARTWAEVLAALIVGVAVWRLSRRRPLQVEPN